jgi:hypothetical protein
MKRIKMKNKKQILSYTLDYLKKIIPDFQKKGKMFTCPKCGQLTANIFPPNSNEIFCFEPDCQKIGNIFSICRDKEFENNEDISDEDIAKHLIKMFSIKTDTHIAQLLEKYASWDWDLVPIANDKKIPVEKKWPTKNHKDIREWQEWINTKLGLGLKTGLISNTTVIDVDLITKAEAEIWQKGTAKKQIEEIIAKKEVELAKLKELDIFNDTVMQDSGWKGVHYFYTYESDIPKCSFDYEGLHFDVENDGGYVLIEPSTYVGKTRQISGDNINQMNSELKKLILEQNSNTPIINKEELNFDGSSDYVDLSKDAEKIKGLEGCCNSTFVKIGGMFRKFMNIKQTNQALSLINKYMLDSPMINKDLVAMTEQIHKYSTSDDKVLYNQVYEFLKKHEEASVRDLKECLNAEPKDIKEILATLIAEDKVFKQKSLYKIIQKADWKTEFIQESKVLPYDIPYFQNVATFRRGDMICIGGRSGVGKSYIALNIIRKILANKVQPTGGVRYLSSEPGNRFAKIAMELGLKEGDFYFCNHYSPEKVELEDDAVTIVDWLLPEDFSQTANLYKIFARQLDKHGGVLYIFSQLKEDGNFYADQMVKFFASLATKYIYTESNGVADNRNTCFKTEKIRESKTMHQYLTIPTYFNDNKFLELK